MGTTNAERGFGKRSVFAALVAVIVAVAAAAGCGDKAESEASYIERGKSLAAKGDLVGADVMYRNALQINPKSVEALIQLATNAERRGDAQAAYRLYLRASEEKADNVLAQAKLGQIYAAGGDLERARAQVDVAGRLDPQHPEVMLLEGLIAFRSGDFTKAMAQARQVLARFPDNVDANGLLARALDETGQVDAAIAAYDAALASRPDATALRVLKTKTLERAGRIEAAAASLRDLIAREPVVYEYRRALARMWEAAGRATEAEGVLREAIAANVGESRPKLDLVDLLARQGKETEAEAELKQMAAAAPQDYPLQFRLAERYVRTGRAGEGKATLEAIVARDSEGPNGVTARVVLARLAFRQGEADRGDRLVADVLAREAGNADALMLRAARALERGDPEPAIVDLRTVLRDNPNAREAKRMLANAYFRAGKSDLAERELVALAEQDAGDLSAKYDLAYLQARRGAGGEALALLDEVTAAAPQLVAPLRAKAMMQIVERQWPAAEETIRRIEALPDQQLLANMLSGVLYLASDRPKDAVAAFQRAHALAPTASAPINGVIRAQLRLGDTEAAGRFLRDLIAKNPESAYLHNSYGELLLLTGKAAEAKAAWERAKALAPDWPLLYFNLSRAYVGGGDAARAAAVIDEGLAKRPEDPLLLRAKADSLVVKGEMAGALDVYLKLLAVQPENLDAANNAAAIIADVKADDAAALKRAVELAGKLQDSASPNYLDTVGWVRYRTGDYQLAQVSLIRAVKRAPDDPVINYHLGMVRMKLGDLEGARAALEKAVAPGVGPYPGRSEAEAALRQLGGGPPR
jgi:tetratricopeptide (TPR) repeat protein